MALLVEYNPPLAVRPPRRKLRVYLSLRDIEPLPTHFVAEYRSSMGRLYKKEFDKEELWDRSIMPSRLYHTTAHLRAVVRAGFLQGFCTKARAGLGSNSELGIGCIPHVSLSYGIETVQRIKETFEMVLEFQQSGHVPIGEVLTTFARRDEKRWGLEPGWLDEFIQYCIEEEPYFRWKAFMEYLRQIEEYSDETIPSVAILGSEEAFYGLKQKDIAILSIPTRNVPEDAVLEETGELHEVRVYADVPLTRATLLRRLPLQSSFR